MIDIIETAEFSKWLLKLKDKTAKQKISLRVQRLAFGNPGDVKPVGEGVSELRIPYGPGYRVYYTQRGNVLIILLCGGDKSTQSKDIKKAKAMLPELEEDDENETI